MEVNYQIWDVFTNKAFSGNPLAVITDASELSDLQMQQIAREFNLSETSFILPRQNADYRARYFTPSQEVPMAGHPTIGTIFSLWHDGLINDLDELRLELNAGVFPIKLDYKANSLNWVWMNQGIPKVLAHCEHKHTVAKALGLAKDDIVADLPLQVVSAGLEFLLVPLKSLRALARTNLKVDLLPDILPKNHRAVFAFTTDTSKAKVRSRMFGEALGVIEDPATGSAHGPLGFYMASHGLLDFENGIAKFSSIQGVEMGRASEIQLKVSKLPQGYQVEIAGQAIKVAEGKLFL